MNTRNTWKSGQDQQELGHFNCTHEHMRIDLGCICRFTTGLLPRRVGAKLLVSAGNVSKHGAPSPLPLSPASGERGDTPSHVYFMLAPLSPASGERGWGEGSCSSDNGFYNTLSLLTCEFQVQGRSRMGSSRRGKGRRKVGRKSAACAARFAIARVEPKIPAAFSHTNPKRMRGRRRSMV